MGKIDWIETENPEVRFENNAIGRIKKEVWDADEAQPVSYTHLTLPTIRRV